MNNVHPENVTTKTFSWTVNGVHDLSIEVETAKPGTMTSYLPIDPELIAFQVERDGSLIIRTSDAYFSIIRGKRVLVIKKELDVAVELPVNIAKALWPHDYMFDPVDGKADAWWQFA